MKKGFLPALFLMGIVLCSALVSSPGAETCRPTSVDMLGPFYKPDAPVRSSVGKGYTLQGLVRSSKDCSAIAGARIEFWLAGPDGEYDDAHRATVMADASGAYRFESNRPRPYAGRPSHIHIRISAQGFETLVTQHYPKKERVQESQDLVLVPQADRFR